MGLLLHQSFHACPLHLLTQLITMGLSSFRVPTLLIVYDHTDISYVQIPFL
jgi:hypothetical protein